MAIDHRNTGVDCHFSSTAGSRRARRGVLSAENRSQNRLSFEDINGLPAEVEFSCGPRKDDPTLANEASIDSFRPGDGAVLVTWEVSWPHDAWGAGVCTLRFTTSSGQTFEKNRIEGGSGKGAGRHTADMPFKVPDGVDPADVSDVEVSCVPWSPGD